jgi:hypothetical protein
LRTAPEWKRHAPQANEAISFVPPQRLNQISIIGLTVRFSDWRIDMPQGLLGLGGRTTVQQETTTVELRYTKQDYIAAQKLHWRLSIRGKWVCGLFIISSAAVALILLAMPSAALYRSWAPLFAFLPIFTLVYRYCLIWFYVRFVATRNFKKQPLMQLPQRLTLLLEGIRYESDRGTTTLIWRDFIKWRADGKLVLAYLSPRLPVHDVPNTTRHSGLPDGRLKGKVDPGIWSAKALNFARRWRDRLR